MIQWPLPIAIGRALVYDAAFFVGSALGYAISGYRSRA